MIAPTSVSTIARNETRSPNSSGMSVSVAPAALPMPSARWPAFRPIEITKNQCDVVLASTMRFFTISTPTWRAVWKPNVSMCGGRSRSLSMVFGTCTTRSRPPECSTSFIAENAVSSPPIVMSCVTPRLASAATHVLEVLRIGRRVGARDAEERAAAEVDAAHVVDAERRHVLDLALHDPAKAVADAEHARRRRARSGSWRRRSRC